VFHFKKSGIYTIIKNKAHDQKQNTQEDRMLLKKKFVFKPKLFVILSVMLGLVISSQFLHMPAASRGEFQNIKGFR